MKMMMMMESRSDRWTLVEVQLCGGAPWGFTLRGGLEHNEPLLITKVEEGSQAAAVKLQVGDEIVSINGVLLSGYRQEAICLVKGSHKTLSLVVRRKMKMVDFVAQKMPSESDVHVARSFLTKILRSSMRKNRFKGRNEPVGRPHSWHSTKFTEHHLESDQTQETTTPVWPTRYDASCQDQSKSCDQTNLWRISDQFSSVGSMDSLDQSSHPYPLERLSPAKSNNSIDHLGVGIGGSSERDSANSSYSTSSSTPDDTLSKSHTASTENMLYKMSQWDSAVRPSSARNNQNLTEMGWQDERQGYLPPPPLAHEGRDGPRIEEQPGSRSSNSSRSSIGPVWHIPEKKRPTAPSPPPPLPPVRSDSYVATKVHEKGLAISYSEGHGPYCKRPHSKSIDKGMTEATSENVQCGLHLSGDKVTEVWRNYNAPPKTEMLPLNISADGYNNNTSQLTSNKMYSLSSTDVRLGQPPYTGVPYHQRQYSDESTFYQHPRAPPTPKQQNVASYYSSMQDLPTHNQSHMYYQTQVRTSNASLSSTGIDEMPDNNRYFCVTTRQQGQSESQASLKVEAWKGNTSGETNQSVSDRCSVSFQKAGRSRYPQLQQSCPNIQNNEGHFRQQESQTMSSKGYENTIISKSIDVQGMRSNMEQGDRLRRNNGYPAEVQDMNLLSAKHPDQNHKVLQPKVSHAGSFLPTDEAKICPWTTPMLHSLSQESMTLRENSVEGNNGGRRLDPLDPLSGKQVRRSDRYATTLRNEIQVRRAQLQKSKSAATLTGTSEAEEETETQKTDPVQTSNASEGAFSSTYKDHLKEAQARVLRATSFQRKDLEPVKQEHSENETMPSYLQSSTSRKDMSPMPSLLEVPQSKFVSGPVSRIGARKRFPAEKKVRSYSEPDKINEVGVEADVLPPYEPTETFAERRKFFEATGKPTFPKPLPKPVFHSTYEEHGKRSQPKESEEAFQGSKTRAFPEGHDHEGQSVPWQEVLHEQQRLGTFAEYEATWNVQRKPPETRSSGRYHSADNILEPGVEEWNKVPHVHERSRSSPSADFYGQNIPVLGRKSAEHSQTETLPPAHEVSPPLCSSSHSVYPPSLHHAERSWQLSVPDRLSDRGSWDKRVPSDEFPPPPPELLFPADHSPPVSLPSEPQPSPKKGPIPQRPPPPKLDKYRRLTGTTPSSSDSQESLTGQKPRTPPSDLHPGSSPLTDSAPSTGSAPSPGKEAPQGTGPEDTHGAALTQLEPPPPMDGSRSLSPQFAPQRLTDRPPLSLQDELSDRMENVRENNSAVKKVPIKIVCAESNTEKESRQYLVPSEATPTPSDPSGPQLPSLGSTEQSGSPFCAYMRQPEPELQSALLSLPSELTPATMPNRHEEERKREELTRDIVDRDRSLADILDQSRMKTTMDLMEGIYPQGEQLLEGAQQRRKAAPKQPTRKHAEESRPEEDNQAAAVAMVTSSSYYSTSAPKAELLIKMKDMQEQIEEHDSEDELDIDLANKKHELIDSLSRKLQVLREARESLQEDVQENNALGEDVELTVQQVCKPNELDKFRMFVGNLDKVVSLLLSLSGRLARVENALNNLEEGASPEEKRTLMEKRKMLIHQHDDAKELKENLDRRGRAVYDILASYLSEEDLADYEHFVKMKSALIIEQRKLEDKIKLGEEQLKCLTDSLPLDQRVSY